MDDESRPRQGIRHVIPSFSVIWRAKGNSRRSCRDERASRGGGRGHLIEWGDQEGETCGLKGSKLAGGVVGGFAATGNPVPKGASQLPRPAIIRLSGVTISVNVLDFELRLEPETN